MNTTYTLHNLDDWGPIVAALFESAQPGLVALSGDLGAGKTTLCQRILATLGATGPYPSPTYTIMQEYMLPESIHSIDRVYHVDAYRLDEEQMREAGFPEWVADPRGLVLLEWPQRVPGLLSTHYTEIRIQVADGVRTVTVTTK